MLTRVQLRISASVPPGDREELLLLLREHTEIEQEAERDLATAWHLFTVFVQDAAPTAALLYAAGKGGLELVEKVLALREKLRARGEAPAGRILLARPGEAPEDLLIASPERVRAILGGGT